ncbi:hypothetical protein AMTRI_Chr12g269120 [Amborella trichopoda]
MTQQFLSRKASCNSHGQDSSYFLGWQEYEKNAYDEIKNPSGIIQMGLAENQVAYNFSLSLSNLFLSHQIEKSSSFLMGGLIVQLSFDLLESWLAENPEAAGFKHNGASVFRELALFQDYHGMPSFKSALASFMGEIRGNKASFDPARLVLTAGATSANEILMFCVANRGEAFLIPTPYYPGFDRDLKWRTEVEIVPIHCDSSNDFQIRESALEAAYKSAMSQKLKVKGILITNPSNPLGTTMTRATLKMLLSFIADKGIHLVCDEIYSGTVFGSPNFVSIAEVLPLNHPARQRVHLVYSLSKDLGLPGFRVGAIYSYGDTVVAEATKMSSFGLVSSQTQHLLAPLLSDNKFTSSYLVENRRRLKQRQQALVRGLQNSGISCLQGNSGLFCWVNMSHLLQSPTFAGEIELWKSILYEVGLNISPGSSCHCTEPGWFRLCFANMSQNTLDVALQRIQRFVSARSSRNKTGSCATRHGFSGKLSFRKWVLRSSTAAYSSER